MTTLVESRRLEFEQALNVLLQQARAEGYTINLETKHFEPLRMGNYGQRITVHLAHELYRIVK
jgi:hypothetical protein